MRIPAVIVSERGATLFVCILILIVLSLIGSIAIMNSTTENKVTHTYRKSGISFFAADGGCEQSQGIVRYFIAETPVAGDKTDWRTDVKTMVNDSYFVYEIMGISSEHNDGATDTSDYNPDISTVAADNNVSIDIDRMNKDFAVGGNVEWGTEGGMGLGGGEGVAVFYRIESKGQYKDTNTTTNVETLYRHFL